MNNTNKETAKPKTVHKKVKAKVKLIPHHVLRLDRYQHGDDYTLGKLYLDDKFMCYTLEDEQRDDKIEGETRIDAGVYNVGFIKQLTGLTKKYRARFKWFKWHLEIKGLPRHTNIYIHIGNTDEDTEGCVLVGDVVYKNTLGYSVKAYTALYAKLSELLEAGDTIEIQIINKD